jgi:hypothetical protein
MTGAQARVRKWIATRQQDGTCENYRFAARS